VYVRNIQPAVQRRHGAVGEPLEQREMQQVGMEMQDVKAGRRLSNVVEHVQVRGRIRPERVGIQAQRLLADGDQARLGSCIRRRK
jgi:hypothetical protein